MRDELLKKIIFVTSDLYSFYYATDAIGSSNNFAIFEYPVKLMFRRDSLIESS
jgi:hypothetical protein